MTTRTYRFHEFDRDAWMFTCTADNPGKDWKSIGCFSVRGIAARDENAAALERSGYTKEGA